MSLSGSVLICVVALMILQTGRVRGIEQIACNVEITDVKDQVHFYLHTNDNRDDPQEVFLDNPDSLINSSFNAALDTRFVMHGWLQNTNNILSEINTLLPDSYLMKGDYNVFVTDWSEIAVNAVYSIPRYKVDDVGLVVARFIEFLVSAAGANVSKIYLLGFSLGAHVAGFAGKFLGTKVPVIIALDPAKLLFDVSDKNCRIADTDADYLLVIHSCVNTCISGIANNIGHADFYVNYGYAVPGDVVDSHFAAYRVMAASLHNGPGYWGKKCAGYFEVVTFRQCTGTGPAAKLGGDPIDTSIRGVYEVDVDILSLLI